MISRRPLADCFSTTTVYERIVVIIMIIALCSEVIAMAEDEEDEEQLVYTIVLESWRLHLYYHRRTSADDANILVCACPTRVISYCTI